MKFLLDADDDWQEGVRRFLYPRMHGVLERTGGAIGIPLFTVGTTDWNQYVGHVYESEDAIEEELVALGFERNPVACLKSLPDGRTSEGSWVLRSRDDPRGTLVRGRQLHVSLFESEDSENGRVLFGHEEQDWQTDPLGHLRGDEFSAADGVARARDLIDYNAFLLLEVR